MKGEVIGDSLVVMDETDTVGTAIDDLDAGFEFVYDDDPVELSEPVPFGHKVALCDCERGDDVRKYGAVIGTATEPIDSGEWVHTHNCESNRGLGDRADGGVDA